MFSPCLLDSGLTPHIYLFISSLRRVMVPIYGRAPSPPGYGSSESLPRSQVTQVGTTVRRPGGTGNEPGSSRSPNWSLTTCATEAILSIIDGKTNQYKKPNTLVCCIWDALDLMFWTPFNPNDNRYHHKFDCTFNHQIIKFLC